MNSSRGPNLFVFVWGVLVGLAMLLLMAGGSLRLLSQRGIPVQVDTEQIAIQVRTEVKKALYQELPGSLETIRREVPGRVAVEMARHLSELTLDLGGLKVPIPVVAAQQVQSHVEEVVRRGLDQAVQAADMELLATRLGDRAYQLVSQQLGQALAGQRFSITPWAGFSIPIILVPK